MAAKMEKVEIACPKCKGSGKFFSHALQKELTCGDCNGRCTKTVMREKK